MCRKGNSSKNGHHRIPAQNKNTSHQHDRHGALGGWETIGKPDARTIGNASQIGNGWGTGLFIPFASPGQVEVRRLAGQGQAMFVRCPQTPDPQEEACATDHNERTGCNDQQPKAEADSIDLKFWGDKLPSNHQGQRHHAEQKERSEKNRFTHAPDDPPTRQAVAAFFSPESK